MRVKHTGMDFYMVRYCIKGSSNETWWSHKGYSTKQAAMNWIKRIREKIENDPKCKPFPLKFKIVWKPYPFCDEEDTIVVYEEN